MSAVSYQRDFSLSTSLFELIAAGLNQNLASLLFTLLCSCFEIWRVKILPLKGK